MSLDQRCDRGARGPDAGAYHLQQEYRRLYRTDEQIARAVRSVAERAPEISEMLKNIERMRHIPYELLHRPVDF